MWMILGFGALGFLVGNLAGISSAQIVKTLLGMLFAFGGGSIIAFLKGINAHDRKVAGASVFAFCIACSGFLIS